MIHLITRISVFYFLLPVTSQFWNLTSLSVPDDVLIWRFAVWRNRAFLAIPRWTSGVGEGRVTLLEVPWPEVNPNLPINVAGTPSIPFSRNGQLKDAYEALASVTGLAVDVRGRLWILDAPDERDRSPRIVIYDLKRNDRLVSSTALASVSAKNLKCLVMDPYEDRWGCRGYIADAGDQTIIVYNLVSGQAKWWRLRMTHGPGTPRAPFADLAVCRRTSMLYATARDTHDLLAISLETMRMDAALHETRNATMTRLGRKLGSSVGLFCDWRDGLHYFMSTERASVRWDTKLPLNARGHSVLIQDNDVPCITDFAMDVRKNVWGLVNAECPVIRKNYVSSKSALKFRTVRVSRYPFTL